MGFFKRIVLSISLFFICFYAQAQDTLKLSRAACEVMFLKENLWLNIYATNVRNINVGMEVNIKTLSYPDEIFTGKITSISQVYDPEAKVLKARIVLENKDYKLKPGMIVDIFASRNRNIEAVSVPTKALVFDDNQNFVVVYKDDCHIEIRKVKVLSKSNGITYIEEGINVHEKIITQNQLLIYERLKNAEN